MAEKETRKEQRIAAIRLRGEIGTSQKLEDTLQMLRLYRRNYCSVFHNDKSHSGMLQKAKDFITWGELDDDTFKLLAEKRGEEFAGRESDKKGLIKSQDFVEINGKKIKKFFRLNSPRKGLERKGLKHPFNKGGALGYRGKDINDLIRRMV